MFLGPSTSVIDGQRVSVQTSDAWHPVAYGSTLQSVPAGQPVLPMFAGAPVSASGVNLTGNDDNAMAAARAGANPFSFRDSPLPWAVVFLLVGLIGLRVIHWRH